MQEHIHTFAGLHTTVVGTAETGQTVVVLLHGYDMKPSDLAPFAHSLKVPALFLLPQGPRTSPNGNHAWWDIDIEARAKALSFGPRDLAEEYPGGAPPAREQLRQFLEQITQQFQPSRLILGGFSQGGMLACDFLLQTRLLQTRTSVDALLLLSASRIRIQDWESRAQNLQDLPVFVSHGRADSDLAFAAGERLKTFAQAAGAQVSWIPFDGGHEIPLIVWRELRKFIGTLLK